MAYFAAAENKPQASTGKRPSGVAMCCKIYTLSLRIDQGETVFRFESLEVK